MPSIISARFFVATCTLMLGLLLAACTPMILDDTSGLVDDYTFRPIDDIVDVDLIVTNFAADTATLPVRTSVPVACTMLYGTTPEFGSVTLDQDMAGGVHSDHNPLLVGLEPETLYYFRVQGIDATGTLYLSEVMTFTTPAAQVRETENLAAPEMGAEVIAYSSAFGGAGLTDRWGPASAFDGNPNSEWSSAGDGNEAFVEVRLARRARIDSIEFQSRSMADGSAITRQFSVVTESGATYGPYDLPDTSQMYTFDVAFEAEILRFALTDTSGGNTGAVDIAVYGAFLEE